MNPKLMICGDWHGNTAHALMMVRTAEKYGFQKIIQCGDFGLWDHYEDGLRFLDTLNEACRKAGVKVYWLDGNHENHERLYWYTQNNPVTKNGHVYIRSHILYSPRGNAWQWENKTFLTVGGGVSVDRAYRKPDVSWWYGEQLTDDEVRGIHTKTDYLFTHDCPANAPFKNRFKNDVDSQIHRQRMSKIGQQTMPSMWFHGHMHEKYDYEFMHQDGYAMVKGLQKDGDAFCWGVLDIPSGEFHWGPNYRMAY